MRQILQSARTGELEIVHVPAPRAAAGCVLVRTAASVVSAGTERATAEFASKSLVQKAKARPDLVKDVLNKIRRDGVLSAFSAVRSRLDQPLALGYSSAGTVIEIGAGIDDLRPGDRVACAGAGFAAHAEFANVPRMLVARIPVANVNFESAAFTTLGAIALHAVRTAEAKLGEVVGVIGLGLIGQLAVQILRAAGCAVVGVDPVPDRVSLVLEMGAIAGTSSEVEFRELCLRNSNGYGVDSVLITAETPSSGPVNLASQVARDRGTVVAVGAVGMELDRRLYYEKELDFRVSRSYGPGRYDEAYEQKGRDYPIGHVRWSETRNMEAFLQLLADGKVKVGPLISHHFAIDDAISAYELITGKIKQQHLGVLLQYSADENRETHRLDLVSNRVTPSARTVRVGMLGAGNFARGVLIRATKGDSETQLAGICASNGVRAHSIARKFGFEYCATDEQQIFADQTINTVVIATRHHLHASQIIRALEHGKHVFCEKPLCLREEELFAIREGLARAPNCKLTVGFNRRFAPMVRRIKGFLSASAGPFTMIYRVNAGPLPPDHWINDPDQGGGRVLGEMCHFVDLLSYFCGSAPALLEARSFSGTGGQDVSATIQFENGSIGTICYIANGDRTFPKERIEIFGSNCVAVLNDFRTLELVRHGKKKSFHSWFRQEKGHSAEWQAFCECIRSGSPSPIPFEEIALSTLTTIRILESLRSDRAMTISESQPTPVTASLVC